MYSVGIDIGGMSAKIGVVKEDRVVQTFTVPTQKDLDYSIFIDEVCELVGQIQKQYQIKGIGISSCGLIDSKQGMIRYSNNIQWEQKPIVKDVSERIGCTVKIANDAKCAALAEAVYGAGKNYERLCMLTLGTGVGGGFINHKRIENGNAYCDADSILGHITVERDGRLCTCGRKGCLEAYASATAVMKRYREKTEETISAKKIFLRAREGEKAALETINEFKYYLGEGLVSLVNVLRPEVVAIGGGMAKSADLFLNELNDYVNRYIYGGDVLPVKIVAAQLENEAGMIGAALL